MGHEASRLFVTGTDTGVGKTEAACAPLSLLAEAGLRPAAIKSYESGCLDWRRPADALAMKAATRCDDPLDRVCLYRYRAPLAPGVAAARHAGSRSGSVCAGSSSPAGRLSAGAAPAAERLRQKGAARRTLTAVLEDP